MPINFSTGHWCQLMLLPIFRRFGPDPFGYCRRFAEFSSVSANELKETMPSNPKILRKIQSRIVNSAPYLLTIMQEFIH